MKTAALFVALLLALTGCGVAFDSTAPSGPQASATKTSVPRPEKIEIPSINASGDISTALGLNPDGSMETPLVEFPELGGYFRFAPLPGLVGPAVVIAHVDGNHKEGLFFRLKNVKNGDLVKITRTDGSVLTFKIYDTKQVSKSAFPADSVYANTAGPEIRLVTCTGQFDREARSYVDNFIAFGKLV